MRRRELIAGLFLAATVRCAWGQQRDKVYRLAIVHPSDPVSELTESGPNQNYGTFFKELRRLGYVEGQNLAVERYSGAGHTEHYAELASHVVQLKPDLIVTHSAYMIRHFKAATATIPVVGFTADPVAFGIVPSLAHPGSNVTGVVVDAGIELWGKRFALLREAIPRLSTVSFLASRDAWQAPPGTAVREAARLAGISLVPAILDGPLYDEAYRRVFTMLSQDRVDAIIVGDQSENLTNRQLIVQLVEKAQLPAIYPYREFAEIGGLIVYTVDRADLFRHAAEEISQILKGVNPGDIPFYQSTKFALIINLKATKALGLTIPASLVLRADEVIE